MLPSSEVILTGTDWQNCDMDDLRKDVPALMFRDVPGRSRDVSKTTHLDDPMITSSSPLIAAREKNQTNSLQSWLVTFSPASMLPGLCMYFSTLPWIANVRFSLRNARAGAPDRRRTRSGLTGSGVSCTRRIMLLSGESTAPLSIQLTPVITAARCKRPPTFPHFRKSCDWEIAVRFLFMAGSCPPAAPVGRKAPWVPDGGTTLRVSRLYMY